MNGPCTEADKDGLGDTVAYVWEAIARMSQAHSWAWDPIRRTQDGGPDREEWHRIVATHRILVLDAETKPIDEEEAASRGLCLTGMNVYVDECTTAKAEAHARVLATHCSTAAPMRSLYMVLCPGEAVRTFTAVAPLLGGMVEHNLLVDDDYATYLSRITNRAGRLTELAASLEYPFHVDRLRHLHLQSHVASYYFVERAALVLGEMDAPQRLRSLSLVFQCERRDAMWAQAYTDRFIKVVQWVSSATRFLTSVYLHLGAHDASAHAHCRTVTHALTHTLIKREHPFGMQVFFLPTDAQDGAIMHGLADECTQALRGSGHTLVHGHTVRNSQVGGLGLTLIPYDYPARRCVAQLLVDEAMD